MKSRLSKMPSVLGAIMATPLDDSEVPVDHKIYLRQKGDGGEDGLAGTRYEVFVASYHLVLLASQVLKETLDPTSVFVTWQFKGMYIDDVVIQIGAVNQHFEMKTGGNEYWGLKLGTIRWNFQGQRRYDTRHRRQAEYHLYLANPAIFDTLYSSRAEWINVHFFPNTAKVTEINASAPNFIETVIGMLPFENQREFFQKLSGSQRHFLEFDYNDVAATYQCFQRGFQTLSVDQKQTLDVLMARAFQSSAGLVSYRQQSFREGVKKELDKIDGIDLVAFNGAVFFTSAEGIFGRAPIELGGPSGEVFQDFVLSGYFANAQELRDYMEELENADEE
ncbi:hypothetical protein ACC721_05630 [Rhizobium ruizarguesonis]